MSQFLNSKYVDLHPYIPGEQPTDRAYIKLNANETSLPPSPKVLEALSLSLINGMGKYADPHCRELRAAIGEVYNISPEQIFVGNGSDEVLGICFMSFFSESSKICFPDITYGFYEVYANTFKIDAETIPLKEDFSINIEDYTNTDRHVIIANPNAPTGLVLSVDQIEEIIAAKPDRIVIVDEAYVDYDNDSCVRLVNHYPNLVVVQTFSKSRNLAGARIGFAIASKEIIKDFNEIKFAFNPFNMSAMALSVGIASVKDTVYLRECTQRIIRNREHTKGALKQMGFYVMESHTNFIFVQHPRLHASDYYARLKKAGILTRHYNSPRIDNFLRITIGTEEEMDAVIRATESILAGGSDSTQICS